MAMEAVASVFSRDSTDESHGPSSVGWFFIVVAVLLVIGVVAWVVSIHLRAHRLGLPRPTLASYLPHQRSSSSTRNYSSQSGGVIGWVTGKWDALKNGRERTAGGAYEEPLSGVRGRRSDRGAATLDPDEAWDSRVGAETDGYGPGGYYEEQELGLHDGTGAPSTYAGGGYAGQTPGTSAMLHSDAHGYGDDEAPRGRSRSRDPSVFDEERHGPHNPFGERAEPSNLSLRGISPRPMDANDGHSKPSLDESPTERKSMFREGSLG